MKFLAVLRLTVNPIETLVKVLLRHFRIFTGMERHNIGNCIFDGNESRKRDTGSD